MSAGVSIDQVFNFIDGKSRDRIVEAASEAIVLGAPR